MYTPVLHVNYVKCIHLCYMLIMLHIYTPVLHVNYVTCIWFTSVLHMLIMICV